MVYALSANRIISCRTHLVLIMASCEVYKGEQESSSERGFMAKHAENTEEKSIILQLIHTARLQRTRAAELLNEIGLFPGQDQVLQSLFRQLDTPNESAESDPASETATGLAVRAEGIAMGDLAAELRVRAPTVSKTIARLTAQGLVERRAANDDKRQVYVALTETGRARARSIEAITAQLEAELTQGLDAKDRKRFRKLLRKAAKNLAHATGDPIHGEDHDEGED